MAFQDYILRVRDNPGGSCPDLNRGSFSFDFEPRIEVEKKSFRTRLEMAEYLDSRFGQAGITKGRIIGENGLWTWLAYHWFDQLVPLKQGSRRIGKLHRYICSTSYRHYYRHLVAAAYDIYTTHGRANSMLFLGGPVHKHNDFVEQIASRKYIIQSKHLVEVLHRLYWDEGNRSPKRGSDPNWVKSGTLRDFVRVIDQVRLTYDLEEMEPDATIGLLPRQFKRRLR